MAMKPRIAAERTPPITSSAQTGLTAKPCDCLARRALQSPQSAAAVPTPPRIQDQKGPMVPLIPPKSWKVWSSGPMVWPEVRYQATLRQMSSPPASR